MASVSLGDYNIVGPYYNILEEHNNATEGWEMIEGTLRTGLVIAGGYADKVRRVLFAQLKDAIKSGQVEAKEVARAAGELNRLLYEIIVNKLGIDKGDVVRVTVEYVLENGSIKWKLDTLRIEAWQRIPEERIATALSGVVEQAQEILAEAPAYTVERVGETDTGDIVFKIKLGERDAGALLVTPLDGGQALVRASFLEPAPKILKKVLVDLEDTSEDSVRRILPTLLERAEDAERRQAERVFREILVLAGAEE